MGNEIVKGPITLPKRGVMLFIYDQDTIVIEFHKNHYTDDQYTHAAECFIFTIFQDIETGKRLYHQVLCRLRIDRFLEYLEGPS